MNLSDRGLTLKAVPMALGIAFFFLVGLAGGAYFNSVSVTGDDGSKTVAATPDAGEAPSTPAVQVTASTVPQPPSSPSAPVPVAQTPPAANPLPAQTVAATLIRSGTAENDHKPVQDTVKSPPPMAKPAAQPQPIAASAVAMGSSIAAHPPRFPSRMRSGVFYQVQLGVFASADNAHHLSRAADTAQLRLSVIKSGDGKGARYAVRSVPFDSRAAAVAAAAQAQMAARQRHFADGVSYVILRRTARETATAER